MRLNDSKIEEIKNRTDIVDLVGQYVTLKKAGRNYTGLCPFHSEKTPSFTVSREKQIFYCFGCGQGGNVITFLMKIANKTFPEAIKDLAERAGVFLPPPVASAKNNQKSSLRKDITDLNLMVAQQYTRVLNSPAGKQAKEYLKQRGISEETIKHFRLGFAPDAWRFLTNFLEENRVPLSLAQQAGLIATGKEESFYDRFRGRLIFPIENVSGEIVAFGGRLLSAGEPKYLNSPESPVYIKGRNLYGLNRTREEIRNNGFALIVEGYFDLISLWNAGIGNVVASLGTALNRDQLELLRRYTTEVVALFDSDEAGRKALDRSLELFLSMNIKARALVLPDGLDPDDYVRKFGGEPLKRLIADAPSLSDYYIENVLASGKTFEETRDASSAAMEFIGRINDEIEKNLFIKRVAEKLGISQELFKREANRKEARLKSKPVMPARQSQYKVDPVEMNFICLLLEYPQKALRAETEDALDFFMQPELKILGKKIISTYKLLGFIDVGLLLSADEEAPLREKIFQLMMAALPVDDVMLEKIFADNIRQIKKKWYKEQHLQLKLKLIRAQEIGNSSLVEELLREKEKIIAQEKTLF